MTRRFISVIVAVTGTPGTGKTAACSLLPEVTVIDLREIAEEHAELFSYDEDRESLEIDPSSFQKLIPDATGIVVLEGHFSHLLTNDITVVLRCSPKLLRERLSSRDWSREKIQENIEAEAVDVILIESLEDNDTVLEVDTSELSIREVADAISSIINGERGKYEPGNIDWSEEVIDWY